nr:hypothetical protein BHI3_09390 [Bacteriovorax sp. HI3]
MKRIFSILLLMTLASCASLNSQQKSELKEWQASNLEVQEKSPGTAAALNILPGFGDFYNGNVGLGIVNLLFWPASILWAPVGGATGAEEINYYVTKKNVELFEKNKKLTQTSIDEALYYKKINDQEHMMAVKKLASMDLKEFKTALSVYDLIPARIPSSQK